MTNHFFVVFLGHSSRSMYRMVDISFIEGRPVFNFAFFRAFLMVTAHKDWILHHLLKKYFASFVCCFVAFVAVCPA